MHESHISDAVYVVLLALLRCTEIYTVSKICFEMTYGTSIQYVRTEGEGLDLREFANVRCANGGKGWKYDFGVCTIWMSPYWFDIHLNC